MSDLSDELIAKLKKNEKLVTRVAEVLALKRPIVLGGLLIFVWGLFIFAYSVEAGFFASIFLIISAFYVLCILYAAFGEKIDQIFFKPLEDNSGVPTIEECAKLIEKIAGDGSFVDKVTESTNSTLLIVAGICFVLAIVFKFIPPFWFNFVVVTGGILAFPIYTVIQKQKNGAPSQSKQEKPPKPVEEELQQSNEEQPPADE